MGVNTVVKDYGTAVLNAIRENDVKTLRHLMEKHLHSNHKIAALCVTDIRHRPTKKFACPLILAARQEDPSIIAYMMSVGVDPNYIHHTIYTTKRRETVTALHIAVDLCHYSTAEVLLNSNADPNIPDHNNETSLHIAVKKSDRVMTRMLLAKGADPTITDQNGNAALHTATLYGHLQLIKTLLKYDADVYQKGQHGAIPSHIAAREGHIHLVQVFCARDAGIINIKIPCFADGREKAPIHLAAENGHVETVIALLDQFHASVNLKDSDGNTPLHCVVLNMHHPYKMRDKDFFYAAAKVLVKYRVSINEKNVHGETALHLAAVNRHQKIVELLVSVGANPFAENDKRLKPIDLVPESDPVTRQILMTAMTNPRPPVHASTLSLHKDLNISLPPNFNSSAFLSHMPARVLSESLPNNSLRHRNKLLPPAGEMSLANLSVRSNSSTISSVFADDAKARQKLAKARVGSSRLDPVSESGRGARNERENEIPLYSRSGKDRTSSGRSAKPPSKLKRDQLASMSDDDSQSSRNNRDAAKRAKKAEETQSGGRSRGRSVDVNGSKRIDSSRSKRDSSLSTRKDGTMDSRRSSSRPKADKRSQEPSKRYRDDDDDYDDDYDDDDAKVGRGRVYENVGQRRTSQSRSGRDADKENLKGDRRRQEIVGKKQKEGRYAKEIQYENVEDMDEDGIRVHTVPGKPSTIEVSYKGGPITISVDTQDTQGSEMEQDEEEEDSYGDLPADKRGKTKDREGRPKNGRPDVRRRGEDGPVYSNQEAMMEMKRKQEEKARRERVKAMEREREKKIQAEMERNLRKQEEEEERARKEEREKRRARKLERKRVRQEEYEAYQTQLEGVPTEELADGKPFFVMKIPDEVKDEPSFDIDEYEKEQNNLKDSARQRASLVAEGIRKRWSQDEDDDVHDRASLSSGGGPKKPPRPTVPRDYSSSDAENMSSEVNPALRAFYGAVHDETLKIQGEQKAVKPAARSGRKSAEILSEQQHVPQEDSQSVKSAPVTFISEYREIRTERLETLQTKTLPAGKTTDRTADSKIESMEVVVSDTPEEILDYAKEPRSPGSSNQGIQQKVSRDETSGSSSNKFDISEEEVRFGLNMRVTGEAPKAYTKRDHASARRAFMLAPPIGIESSSEASDSEFGSRLSLTESPGWDKSRQRKMDWPKRDHSEEPVAGDVQPIETSVELSKRPLGGYAKPYKSFGKINPDVSALEEALQEALQHSGEVKSADVSSELAFNQGDIQPVVLSTFASNASTEVNVHPNSPKAASRTIPAREVPVSKQDQKFSTIASNNNKLSQKYQLRDDDLSKAPEERHIKANDIVHADDDDDDDDESFDDSMLDELNGESSMEYDVYGRPKPVRPQQSPARSLERLSSSREEPVRDVNGLILPRKVSGSPTAFALSAMLSAQQPVQPVAAVKPVRTKQPATPVTTTRRPSEGLISGDSELETYDEEPGARRTRDRSRDGKQQRPTAEDKEVEQINKRAAGAEKVRTKITKSPDDIISKKSKTKQKDKEVGAEGKPTLKVSIGFPRADIASDVWEEAMSGSPLASSETFERTGPLDSAGMKFVAAKKGAGQKGAEVIDDYTEDDFELSLQNRMNRKNNSKNKYRHGSLEGLDDSAASEMKEEMPSISDRVIGRRQQRLKKDGDHSKKISKKSDRDLEINQVLKEEDRLANGREERNRKDKYQKPRQRSHPAKAIHIDSGNYKPMMVDTGDSMSEDAYLSDSMSETREKISGFLSQLKRDSRLSQSYDDDLNMIPDSMFQVPDITPLSDFPKKYRKRPPNPLKSSKPGVDDSGEPGAGTRAGKDARYRDLMGGVQSDTEAGRSRPTRPRHPDHFHSEAEASDLEPPMAPGPGMSMQQAALQSIHAGPTPRYALPPPGFRVLRQPGHRDKDFTFIRKMYRPPKKPNTSTRHLLAGAGRYGDSELTRRREMSRTDSEGETDQEQELRRRARLTGKHRPVRPDQPPSITEPGPVDFNKYDATARLWMEKVDRRTVQKSNTMYLSVLPEGHDLPREFLQSRYQSPAPGDQPGSSTPPQWVIARSRVLRASMGRPSTGGDGAFERPLTPGRQLIIFFKIGSNWLELAWVLFNGLQSDADTVRMIKDIQLKNPKGLTDQIHDLMNRWWKRKGDDATMDELQRALDTVHMIYIQEEFLESQAFVPYSDEEDALDLGEVPDTDPNVSRLMHEYEVRSLNASFNVENPPAVTSLSHVAPDVVLRSLQNAGVVPEQSATMLSHASRSFREMSRDSSMDRSTRLGGGGDESRGVMSSQESLVDKEMNGDEKKKRASPSRLESSLSQAPSVAESKTPKGKKKKPAVPPKKSQIKRETHL